MRFGVAFAFANYGDWDRFEALERGEDAGPPTKTDAEIWHETLGLIDRVEPLGFDSFWSLEQHAAPYHMVPDPTQILTYVAARTVRLNVGSMITVLPWHNPFRLAEQISILQHVLGPHRHYYLGIGRGLARRNFEAMGVDMDASREIFNEALDILQLAFTREVFSYQGKHFQFGNAAMRPRPLDPTTVTEAWGTWTSEASLRNMAERGLHPLTTLAKTMDEFIRDIELFNELRIEAGHGPARKPIFEAPMFCAESEQEAEEGARRYFPEYIDSVVRMYEIATGRFATGKGYEEYHNKGSQFGDGSTEDARRVLTDKLLHDGIWGTPEQCVEKIMDDLRRLGPQELVALCGVGSQSAQVQERSLRLYAEKVLPRVKQFLRKQPVAPAV
jgi:alkanesulfonate monooxygenase SsuD/methylene tetrahydromethanopterin reductase-like flavin-dependent oxidoreductase (luciferase family)